MAQETALDVFITAARGYIAGAQRLGLVTIDQMIAALVAAVEQPPAPGTVRVLEVPEIKKRSDSRV